MSAWACGKMRDGSDKMEMEKKLRIRNWNFQDRKLQCWEMESQLVFYGFSRKFGFG
ncbi:hypothetical protein CEXT_780991, partial [Caerostris extrusa]